MSEIDELFHEGWQIAEHVGMTEEDSKGRYENRADKEDFIRTLLDYIFWLNKKTEPTEEVLSPKITVRMVDFYCRASDLGE